MPWYGVRGSRTYINHAKSCTKTCELLELYGEDLPRSKFLIRTAPGAPEGIPTSQWERILRGEVLNLDHFLSSIVRTAVNEDRKARLGETQLTFATSEAKRKVRSSSDWAAAWQRASQAIVFAFPHRWDELEEYSTHIQAEFNAKHTVAHQRIILYDIAVRNYVGGGQTTLLTECNHFSHLYASIVLPDGVEFVSTATTRRPGSGRPTSNSEICNKYNSPSGCPHSPCRYKHACRSCGRDHPSSNCNQTQGK